MQTRDALGGPIDDSLGEWRDPPRSSVWDGMLGERGRCGLHASARVSGEIRQGKERERETRESEDRGVGNVETRGDVRTCKVTTAPGSRKI